MNFKELSTSFFCRWQILVKLFHSGKNLFYLKTPVGEEILAKPIIPFMTHGNNLLPSKINGCLSYCISGNAHFRNNNFQLAIFFFKGCGRMYQMESNMYSTVKKTVSSSRSRLILIKIKKKESPLLMSLRQSSLPVAGT